MSAMASGYVEIDKLEEIIEVCKGKGLKGFNFTISINNQTNEYGQNVTLFAEQTKEQQKAKEKKYYFANGKVFWVSDPSKEPGIVLAEKKDKGAALASVYNPTPYVKDETKEQPTQTQTTQPGAYMGPKNDDLPF
jgi:hypothetical protein